MFNFFLYSKDKKIIISNYPVGEVKERYGFKCEILNSIKDDSAVPMIMARIKKQYPLFIIESYIKKPRARQSEETKRKISEALKGKPKPESVKQKISNSLKGRSSFEGKRHREDTKAMMSIRKRGNKHTKDYYWIHDPSGDEEKRIRDRLKVPEGFSLGRDYYSTEPGFYYFKLRLRSSNS